MIGWHDRASSRPHQLLAIVAGQPGAGKTVTTAMLKREVDRRGGAVTINTDDYKPYHPEYARLLAADDQTAALLVSLDGQRWAAKAERYLLKQRVDVVETTIQDPRISQGWSAGFAGPATAWRWRSWRSARPAAG
jgi:UDP-N-acetylglucosamine kinase